MRLHLALKMPDPRDLVTDEDRDAWLGAAAQAALRAIRCGVRVSSLEEWAEQEAIEQEALLLAHSWLGAPAPGAEDLGEVERDLRGALEGLAKIMAEGAPGEAVAP